MALARPIPAAASLLHHRSLLSSIFGMSLWDHKSHIMDALVGLIVSLFAFEGKPPSSYCLVALPLLISSISLYQKYSYLDKKKKKV
ncbi:hypothetical protein YC2023_014177 [Brassica napus]